MELEPKSFSSWKFDWIDALDIGVKSRGRELRVALYLLQRCSSDTKEAWPTQELMAMVLDCELQAVERAVKTLVKEGVMIAQRKSRNGNLHYRFLDAWKDHQLEIKDQIEDQWREIRAARKDPSELIGGEHENDAQPALTSEPAPISTEGCGPISTDG